MFDLEALVRKAESERWVERLWAKDPSLWSSQPDEQQKILNRLGWLDCERFLADHASTLNQFATRVQSSFKSLVIMGMGGSSLCTEVISRFFKDSGGIETHILDSTDSDYIRDLQTRISLDQTLFVVASKSGTTVEVDAFRRYFEAIQTNRAHFIALTDEGTPLVSSMRKELGYIEPVINPSNIGGRFSALSYFGMIPAACMGVSIEKVRETTRRMSLACQNPSVRQNAGVMLGLILGQAATQGKNKLTLLCPDEFAAFGVWMEQLIAESTGKKGLGLLPIVDEPLLPTDLYAQDRVFVAYNFDARRLDELEKNHPLSSFTLSSAYDIFGEFLRWEVATAIAGIVLGLNPFDEPDVNRSKDNTRKLLDQAHGVSMGDFEILSKEHAAEDPAQFFDGIRPPEYGCFLAYVAPHESHRFRLKSLCAALSKKHGVPFVYGFGPRFLHSTGQFHKGGPNQGRFLQITTSNAPLEIPGLPFGFHDLKYAQSVGDLQAMHALDRRVKTMEFEDLSVFES